VREEFFTAEVAEVRGGIAISIQEKTFHRKDAKGAKIGIVIRNSFASLVPARREWKLYYSFN
jgi:hypothetical protein